MSSKKLASFGVSVFFLLISVLSSYSDAFAQWGGHRGWHAGSEMMGGWGFGWVGMILMLIFWILVIAGLVLLIRLLIQKTRKQAEVISGGSSALDILKDRYARGEIEKEEFEEKKKDLMS